MINVPLSFQTQSGELMELCGKRPLVSEAMITFHASVINESESNGGAKNSPLLDRERRSPPRSAPTQDQWNGTLTSVQKSLSDLLNTTQVRYSSSTTTNSRSRYEHMADLIGRIIPCQKCVHLFSERH